MNRKLFIFLLLCTSHFFIHSISARGYDFKKPLYGAAYYSEYTPSDRLDKDISLMKAAGLTVVRVGESTWSLFEPQDGVFEFEWMDRILNALNEAGISVILGTPTYSIPAWMAASHPEVLSHTWNDVQKYYGIRQNMDIYNPTYRFYCERIIRKMMEPGHLSRVCGFTYQEFSSIKEYPIKGELQKDGDYSVRTWLEFIQPTTAKALAYVDDSFFGKWPCITENSYGKGHLIYLATEPSDELLDALISRAASRQGIKSQFCFPISVRSAENQYGDNVHFFFNYSGTVQTIQYTFNNGTSLLDSSPIKKGQTISIEPWGVFVGIEEGAGVNN